MELKKKFYQALDLSIDDTFNDFSLKMEHPFREGTSAWFNETKEKYIVCNINKTTIRFIQTKTKPIKQALDVSNNYKIFIHHNQKDFFDNNMTLIDNPNLWGEESPEFILKLFNMDIRNPDFLSTIVILNEFHTKEISISQTTELPNFGIQTPFQLINTTDLSKLVLYPVDFGWKKQSLRKCYEHWEKTGEMSPFIFKINQWLGGNIKFHSRNILEYKRHHGWFYYTWDLTPPIVPFNLDKISVQFLNPELKNEIRRRCYKLKVSFLGGWVNLNRAELAEFFGPFIVVRS